MTEDRLNQLLASAGMEPLDSAQTAKFATYLQLILKWNARMNLTAVRDEEGILTRHFVECIACARALPEEIRSVLDFGSGAGLPGVPIAICRPEAKVTLAESQSKKTAFLWEAVRQLNLNAEVFSGRAETVGTSFDCVTLRAVDRMEEAIRAAARLVSPGAHLVVMTTTGSSETLRRAPGTGFTWSSPITLPGTEKGIILLGTRP